MHHTIIVTFPATSMVSFLHISKNTLCTLLSCCTLGSMTPLNPDSFHTLLLSLHPKNTCQSFSSLLEHKGQSFEHRTFRSWSLTRDGKCSGYIKIVTHRLILEANGSLYTIPTPFKPPRRLFYKGQNRDGSTQCGQSLGDVDLRSNLNKKIS
jgi:hypothetical protein